MDSTKVLKSTHYKFSCVKCDYYTNNNSNYNKHLSTRKHKMIVNDSKKVLKTHVDTNFECICGKIYKYDSGYYRHVKTCRIYLKENNINDFSSQKNENQESVENKLLSELLKDNNQMRMMMLEQQNQIKEMIPKLGNNNNNTINQKFNLNVFLNEHCKDAINLTEFIESLQIQLKDLENTKSNGLVESIASLLIDNLNEMDMYKRPIHCTDSKRETLYIKDDQKWEKHDEHKGILKQGINELANKQRKAMKAWTEAHPNWRNDEKLKDEYVKLMHELMEPVEESEKDQNKIIKQIGINTIIDKDGDG